jgi:hypothetical protein
MSPGKNWVPWSRPESPGEPVRPGNLWRLALPIKRQFFKIDTTARASLSYDEPELL